MTTTLPARRLAAALSVAALLVSGAACSASGGDAAGDPTTTTAPTDTTAGGDETTTTADDGGDETTTTEATSGEGGDFDDLLPGEGDLPDGYSLVASDPDDGDGSDDFGPELDEACPDADLIRQFTEDEPNKDGQSMATFETEYQQEIEVTIRHANDVEVPLDDLVDAYNACDPLETVQDGTPMTVDFFAETIDLGEESLHMQMDLVIDLGSATLDVEFHGFAFRRDGVSVQVTSSSGVDESDLSTVPPHADEAYEIASAIFDAIGDR